jgi:2,4-dienoyl-CoA reductase (NADPH2)
MCDYFLCTCTGELDAKRAIDQGTRLAACVEDAKAGDVYEAPVGWMPFVVKKVGEYMASKR